MIVLHWLYFQLLQKNVKTDLRLWRRFLCEIFIVSLILIIVVTAPVQRGEHYRLNLISKHTATFMAEEAIKDLKEFQAHMKTKTLKYHLAYAPIMEITDEIIETVSANLMLEYPIGFKTEEEVEKNFDSTTMLAAVIFKNLTIDPKPNKPSREDPEFVEEMSLLSVRIRFPAQFRTIRHPLPQENFWCTRCSGVTNNRGNAQQREMTNIYISEGFLQLQNEIFDVWLRYLLNEVFAGGGGGSGRRRGRDRGRGRGRAKKPASTTNNLDGISQLNDKNREFTQFSMFLRPFRTRNSKIVCPYHSVSHFYDFLLYFLFLLPFCNLIRLVGREREENIMVSHWRYGTLYRKHYQSHFVYALMHLLIIDMIIWFYLKTPFLKTETAGTFVNTGSGYLLIFLVIYNVALIITALVIVTLMVDMGNAVLFGIIVWILNFCVFFSMLIYDRQLPMSNICCCTIFFFGNSFAYTMHLLKYHSHEAMRQYWIILISLAVNIVVYLLLLLLVQFWKPGSYLDRKLVNLCGIRGCSRILLPRLLDLQYRQPPEENFESAPVYSECLMRLKNVTTCYETGTDKENHKLVNISLQLYVGEITVLLGHHGAGKTTLLRVMAGWKPPDFGYVYVKNMDLYEHYSRLARYIDVVMPNNPLYDYLNVKETLAYFLSLKSGIVRKAVYDLELNKWLDTMRVQVEDLKTHVHNLSFDQKRVLSLCCALLGHTRIILIDQPTLHVQIKTKQFMWDLLGREKKHRVIVVTSCSSREAEELGDRIAIMNTGVVEFYGTMFFMKEIYGDFQELFILKSPEASTLDITLVIQSVIPEMQPKNEINNQLIYDIPLKYREKFQLLLIKLETKSVELGIQSVRMYSPLLNQLRRYIDLPSRTPLGRQKLPTKKKWLKQQQISEKYLWGMQMRAMFHMKLLQRDGCVLPIFAVFFSLISINFLFGLINVHKILDVNDMDPNPIQLGIPHTLKERGLKKMYVKGCDFIAVPEREDIQYFDGIFANSHYLDVDSLRCESGDLLEFLTDDASTEDGAIEIKYDPRTYFFHCIVWLSMRPFHAPPVGLNAVHNLLLQYIFPENKQLMVMVENKPFPLSLKQKTDLVTHHMSYLPLSIAVGCLLPFVVATFIAPLIRERRGLFIVMKISGAKTSVYWTGTFLWDFIYIFLYSAMFGFILGIYATRGLYMIYKMYVFIMLLVYFMNALLLVYVAALFSFKSTFRGFLWMYLILLFSGAFLFVFFTEVGENRELLYYTLAILPTFAVILGFREIYLYKLEVDLCTDQCLKTPDCTVHNICRFINDCCFLTNFSWDSHGLLKPLVFATISIFLLLNILAWIIIRRIQRQYFEPKDTKKYRSPYYSFDDPQVVKERKEIAHLEMSQCLRASIFVDQLEQKLTNKTYRLRTVSFKMQKGECLCIFGSARSGKTTLARKLVGELSIRFGEVYMVGYDLRYRCSSVYKQLGYMPQECELLDYSEVRDYFRILFMLRGVPERYISAKSHQLANMLNIRDCLSRKVFLLDEEQRRKVIIAAALITNAKLIILDEPTHGMSSRTKIEIWNVLKFLRDVGVSIIVLTQDIMDCRTLADRVMLFDNFDMLGYDRYLTLWMRHSENILLYVKLRVIGNSEAEVKENLRKNVENCSRYIHFIHTDAITIHQKNEFINFLIPLKQIDSKFSFFYGSLEKSRVRLEIAQYRVKSIMLNDIFYELLAKRQKQIAEREKLQRHVAKNVDM